MFDRCIEYAMPIRKEWTEWHLTPRGWEAGSTRVEGVGNTWRDEPEDRRLSYVHQEQQTGADAEPAATTEESWRTKDPAKLAEIDGLLRRFGECPRRLKP